MSQGSGSITILGENIDTVRPKRHKFPDVPKECFKIRHNTRARTRNIGKREFNKLKTFYEGRLNEPRET
jgi:hypothetical protein